MLLKTISVVLVACAVTFASPVKQDVSGENSTDQKLNPRQNPEELGLKIMEMLTGDDLEETAANIERFRKLFDEKDLKTFNEESDLLKKLESEIPQEKLENKESAASLKKSLDKYDAVWTETLEKAIEMYQKHEEGTISLKETLKMLEEYLKDLQKLNE